MNSVFRGEDEFSPPLRHLKADQSLIDEPNIDQGRLGMPGIPYTAMRILLHTQKCRLCRIDHFAEQRRIFHR
jgi:hypothetical protein